MVCFGALFMSMAPRKVDARSIEGRVMLSDSVSASFATVYLPTTGQGTVCDMDGYFRLDSLRGAECPVEVSYVGYTTHRDTVRWNAGGNAQLLVKMEEEPISLANVLVTPNGEDAAVYLFQKVIEQGEINRRRIRHLEANVRTSFFAQDMDVLPRLMPKALYFVMKSAMRMAGYGVVIDILFKHPKVDMEFSYQMDYTQGKASYRNVRFARCVPELSDKLAKKCSKLFFYNPIDATLDRISIALKYAKKNPGSYRLVGTIEEQGRVVDILEHQYVNGDTVMFSTRYYIMEDVWSLLRYESRSMSNGEKRQEFRNIGGDIYLPVLRVDLPSPIDMNEMVDMAKKSIAESEDKPSAMEASILRRMEDVANGRRKYQPYIKNDYSIQYSNVSIVQ